MDVSRNADGKPQVKKYQLQGDGDFRSEECVALLDEADIVITNPPFSLFREFIDLLTEKGKSFLVIGSMNAITYKDVFGHIKNNRLWLGRTNPKKFLLPLADARKPGKEMKQFGNICWFTNLPHNARNEPLILCDQYSGSETKYPKYDNYDAIEVSRTDAIPIDYLGTMGVPISFLSKYSPHQFDIVGMSANGLVPAEMKKPHFKKHNEPYILGKRIYQRIFIKRILV